MLQRNKIKDQRGRQSHSEIILDSLHGMPFFLPWHLLLLKHNRCSQNISRGSSLTPTTNTTWLTRSGLYAFGFYRQGNGYAVGIFLAGIPQKTVVWTANRDDPPVSNNATLLFTGDGLALPTAEGQNYLVKSSGSSSYASMLDSGNFVLYNSGREIVWQSFHHPTDTLLPGQRLLSGNELFSANSEADHSTGIFRLKMQNDGNLVQYPVAAADTSIYAFYSSLTVGQGENVTLNFGADGHLYLLNRNGTNIRNITDGGLPTDEGKLYMIRKRMQFGQLSGSLPRISVFLKAYAD
ncbi:G-type lectin S-receptor-like serine/threonine-protein kinase LECRK3 [Prunus persica]|uniref:G-type lectin S-receptor-like serine/threonine-protein kinase LECRK3 n=1 Tax=Prunus persica TaxID=3760 RepID=UPI0009AB795F|nr:G-type lectin S-receptor-like serine/threonine-protein kinase LECRK3 [Prunus persica]